MVPQNESCMLTIIPMAEQIIDLRSDTVTQPTKEMRQAMMDAPLGDDVWGDDPTVNLLQERCASLFGKEDACFVPSGTMANQLAIRCQTQPGDEIIVHKESHIVWYEAGGAAALSGCTFALASAHSRKVYLFFKSPLSHTPIIKHAMNAEYPWRLSCIAGFCYLWI